MLVSRKLAQCSWAGKPGEFDRFWPLPEKYKRPAPKFDKEWWEKIRARNKRHIKKDA